MLPAGNPNPRFDWFTFLSRLVLKIAPSALSLVLCAAAGAEPLVLRTAAGGLPIVTGPEPSTTVRFAADELARYLGRITGTRFAVETTARVPAKALVVGRAAVLSLDPDFDRQQLGDSGFIIRRSGGRVLIAGGSGRGTLYGVYAFLEKLGCRWFAPNFNFYGAASGEFVPKLSAPSAGDWNIVERPAFKWRKLYIEEGWSHTAGNLRQMIDWMAKARMNVLDCPIDYQHLHRTEWDRWRLALIPELRKRGILIEVGGHGYPNFLPQEKYFAQHPDWFGMVNGKRSSNPSVVFSTANPEAVRTFIANVEAYLRAHPEIDILDVWPPDGARWPDAPEDLALGTPSERQILLLNHLAAEIRPKFPKLRIQFIAYASYVAPPAKSRPDSRVLMDFCPIDRSFETPLYASGYAKNEEYFQDLQGWLNGVIDPAHVTIYSYIAKYAWRSLPVLVPSLIVDEARRFHSMGVGGLATYSEPGNWATFELDHYIVARALWNPDLDLKSELADYATRRYGPAAPAVLSYLGLVEEIVPHAIGIPGTRLTIDTQRRMIREFAPASGLLAQAHAAANNDAALQVLLARLDHSHAYVQNEMQLRLSILENAQGWGNHRLSRLSGLLAARVKIIDSDPGDGVILHDNRIP